MARGVLLTLLVARPLRFAPLLRFALLGTFLPRFGMAVLRASFYLNVAFCMAAVKIIAAAFREPKNAKASQRQEGCPLRGMSLNTQNSTRRTGRQPVACERLRTSSFASHCGIFTEAFLHQKTFK